MLQVHVQTTLRLARPTTAQDFVTWLDVDVVDRNVFTGTTAKLARALFAVVHVAAMHERGGVPEEVLPDHGLDVLLPHFDDEDKGVDLLYLFHFEHEDRTRAKDLDIAVVQKVYDALCSRCRFVLVPHDKSDDERWRLHGFYVPDPARASPACLYWDTTEWHDRVRVEEAA